ncbi:MAG: electron transfer flavoprotein subunit alpha/FixB family protein [Bacteroides sp.]|jgi:electron transfer flavoprotein alpha subunit|nr:electron transfer flavoprotein subunit alpha/FixB family protein [Bacteroides sp.]
MSVLIYAENWDGQFKKLTFELASYGARVAEMLGTTLVAASIGKVEESQLKQLGHYGVEKVVVADDGQLKHLDSQAYARVIAQAAQKEGSTVIIMASNNAGKSIAPRLSVRLKAALGSGVNKLPVSTDPFIVNKKVFSGSAFAHLSLDTPVKIITLLQNSFDLVENPVDIAIEQIQADLGGADVKTQVNEVRKQEGKILLTDAEIVVSGGRGMKSPDNWKPIEELAELLNAATACSRPVSDEGWRPHEEHTGQTGKIIAPNLYFAIGISGATQHLAGVSSSKYIVAINNDKSAPIFEAAQYGIVGDAQKILPQLIEAVKEIRNK